MLQYQFKSWPKVFQLGDRNVSGIFDNIVEITEKLDGSQFNFGKVNGQVMMKARSAEVFYGDENKMFNLAKDFVKSIEGILPDNTVLHGEYLNKPKHNTLEYERVPKGNFALYGITDLAYTGNNDPVSVHDYATRREKYAEELGCDVVPVLGYIDAKGNLNDALEIINDWLNQKSELGKCNLEGIVIKNYNKPTHYNGADIPFMQAKLVTAEFKEKHKINPEFSKDRVTLLGETFHSEARWRKAVQFMRDSNILTDSTKDIGPLLGRISKDILEEEQVNIKDDLFKLFWKDIQRISVRGFPEWYKAQLLENV